MIGTKLADRYEILAELGRGGMGVVYRARDPLLDREVAIKVVPPALLTPDAELRFQREAQIVAKMDHPAIVTVYDIGRHDGALYFVMPIVGGTNLRTLLRERELRLGDVVDIGIQVADALEYSHSLGVVHRDIKPENVMVWRGAEGEGVRVRIMDFGLARASLESQLTRITHSGTLIGTVSYFSPEQVSVHREVDARSDVYSLGVVLYECLLGEPPFSGEVQSVLYRIVHEVPQTPTSRGADVDLELEQIAMRCIARDPAQRPQTAREVADALTRYRLSLDDDDRRRSIAMASTRVGRPGAFAREATVLTGRERELAELQHRLNVAVAGECQFVVVGGEAGIGKSRLLEELERLARARRIRVLHGRFVEQDRAFPYQGFCDVVQEYFRSREGSTSSAELADFSDLAPELAYLFPLLAEIGDIRSASHDSRSGDAAPLRRLEDRSAVFELIARTLARIGGGRPLVLLLEDLHDADVSLEALQYVVRRLGPTPTLVVGTYRTSEVDRRHALTRTLDGFHGDRRFSQVVLGPMPASEHRHFVEALVGGVHVGDSFARALYSATEGNPFFTRELVRSLVDAGGIAEDDAGAVTFSSEMGISTDALPETIQQVVEKQIERLDESDREALATAAVLGRTFEYRDLEALAPGRIDVEDAVDRLLRQGLLEEERESRGDRLSFASGVVRDALYAGLSRRRRRSLHRRYAEWLERRHAGKERFWAPLAHHFSQGDVADKAVEYGLRAARRSLEAFGSEEAVRAAKTALEFLADEEWSGDRRLEGEARVLLAAAYRLEGNVEGALRESERAVRVFERERDASLTLGAILSAAESAWDGRKIEETRKWVERGIEAGRDAGDPDTLSRVLSLGATVANLRGEYDAAREYLEEIERLRPASEEPEGHVPEGGTLVVGLSGPCEQIEPARVRTVEEEEVSSLVFERLFATDERGNLVPLLAERWEALDGGRSLLVTLRAGVRFSDGSPMTALDVKRSFERGIQIDRDSPRPAYAAIVGVAERARAAAVPGGATEVPGLVVRSERELEIRLTEPLPIYPWILSDTGTGVVRAGREAGGEEVTLGTGPFRVVSVATDVVALARNASYWGGAPAALDRVEFVTNLSAHELAESFRDGGLDVARDLLADDVERLLRDPRVRPQLAEAPLKNTCFLLFNASSATVADPEVRRALGGVVRSQDLVWQSLGRLAQPAAGLVPPGMLGHDPGRRRIQSTPAAAAAALAGARSDGGPLTLRAAVSPGVMDRHGTLVENLFGVWKSIGAEVRVETPTIESYLAALHASEHFDVVVCRWSADYDDPDNFTHWLFHSRDGLLRGYYHSSEADAIAEEARAEQRPSVREALYRRFENLLLDAAVVVPLFHEVNYRLVSRDVRGLRVLGTAPYVNYAEIGKAERGQVAGSRSRTAGVGVVHAPGGMSRVESLDPARIDSLAMGEVVPTVFETLTRVVEGARVVPWLARDVRSEEGGRRFRFRLRDDVRFHDGRRLTARDVRYSFERFLQTAEGANRSLLSPIRGARAVIAGDAGDLEGFRILSTLEFAIELETPLRLLPVMLTNPATAILPEGGGSLDEHAREAFVGTGPFRVVAFEPGVRLELERNPDYWRDGYPRCAGLVFTFGLRSDQALAEFRAGRLSLAADLTPSDVEALRHDSSYAPGYREMPRLATAAIALNAATGPLADPELRKRIVAAVPATSIVRRVLGRLVMPAHGLFPPGLTGYEPPRHAPGAVSAAMPRPLDETVELTMATTGAFVSRFADLTAQLSDAFRRAGVRLRIVEVSTTELVRRQREGSVDMGLNTWVADYPDADSFAGLLHTETGTLGTMCGSPGVDRLIDRGRTETEPGARHYAYRQIEDVVTRGSLLIPLFHPRNYRFARPEIDGLVITSYTYPSVAYENLRVR